MVRNIDQCRTCSVNGTDARTRELRYRSNRPGQRSTFSPFSSLAIVSKSGHVSPARIFINVAWLMSAEAAAERRLALPIAVRRLRVNWRAASPAAFGDSTSGHGVGASSTGFLRTVRAMQISVAASQYPSSDHEPRIRAKGPKERSPSSTRHCSRGEVGVAAGPPSRVAPGMRV